ncbi:MAG: DUF3048 domain-containing protein [Candidatus Dormibacteraeota bacterium]|nr:DUF3048 domain-containing protein [Candidatus Dormibacteraeota bacterium]MBV9525747.1 DUF3048 domain-containing protein [Candidatus Dormibacteraeota bacterium]
MIVQVENSDAGRPQSGLQQATIVYEYVAEGGISRFSAIYPVPPAVTVGPVRSARLATISLLRLYQGVLMYSGGSEYINGLLDASNLPHFDEDSAGGDLFRVNSRPAPHNLYTDGVHLHDLLTRVHPPTVSYAFPVISAAPSGGTAAQAFTVPVSNFEQPTWSWDQTRFAWTRIEPDTGPFVDSQSGQPVQAATVIVQQVQVTYSAQVVDVNGVHGVDHQLTGSGAAQVFVYGHEYNATWTQPDAGPPQFKLANGRPAPMAPGLLWIELVPTGSPAALVSG